MSPGTKGLQTYIMNRLLVYLYREFCATEKRGLLPCIRADELSSHFPNLAENFLRKRLKHCADLQVCDCIFKLISEVFGSMVAIHIFSFVIYIIYHILVFLFVISIF